MNPNKSFFHDDPIRFNPHNVGFSLNFECLIHSNGDNGFAVTTFKSIMFSRPHSKRLLRQDGYSLFCCGTVMGLKQSRNLATIQSYKKILVRWKNIKAIGLAGPRNGS
jgi:hypothetical protein